MTMPIERSRSGTDADLPGISRLVILDNNAYRDLVEGLTPETVDAAVATLRAAEAKQGIQALMHPVVAMELVARLKQDNSKLSARTALTAMALHTAVPTGEVAVLEDPEHMIARQFFNATIENNRDFTEILTTLLSWLRSNRTDALEPGLEAFVTLVEKHVADSEVGFVDDMWTYLVKPANPALASWDGYTARPDLAPSVNPYLKSSEARRNIALWQLASIGVQVGRRAPWTPSAQEIDAFVDIFAIGVSLYLDILQRVLVNGANLTKKRRENWFWDFHITLLVGASHQAAGKQVLLVTSDSAIVDAAKASGASNLVMTWNEYRKLLGLP